MDFRISTFGLLGVGLLSGCLDNAPTEAGQNDPAKPPVSARTAFDAGLIDVPLAKIYRHIGGPNRYNNHSIVPPAGYTTEGPYWRILANSAASNSQGHRPLYEVFANVNGFGDHMPSLFTDEGGYELHSYLGNIFTSQDLEMGLFPMKRFVREWTDANGFHRDQMLAKLGEAPAGYVEVGTLGFGWPWGSNNPGDLNYTSKAGTPFRIGTSLNWGGSMLSLKWNGVEMINKYCPNGDRLDGGRGWQSAMWYSISTPPYGDNPTEVGDMWGNGSIVINYAPGGSTGSLWTRSNMLQYGWGRTDVLKDQPVLSGTELKKTVTIVNSNLINRVISYTHSKDPATLPAGDRTVTHEPEAIHLVNGLFNRIRVYSRNASGNWEMVVENDATQDNPANRWWYREYAARNNQPMLLMAYNTSRNQGIAIYVKNPRPCGNFIPNTNSCDEATRGTNFHWMTFAGPGNTGWSTSDNWSTQVETTKLSWMEYNQPFTRGGVQTYNSQVLFGTLAEIFSQANSL